MSAKRPEPPVGVRITIESSPELRYARLIDLMDVCNEADTQT